MGDVEEAVVVLVWTRYQYRLARMLLGKLDVPVERCIFIVESKAVAQGVEPDDALEWHQYDEGRGFMGAHARQLVRSIMKGRTACKLLLRNYNSKIGLQLLRLPFDEVFVLEDGLASYMPRTSFGLPFGVREKVFTLTVRLFNGGRLRALPPRHPSKLFRCGMYSAVEEWAGGRFIDVAPWDGESIKRTSIRQEDVLILDQPLHGEWTMLKQRMLSMALASHPGKIVVYMHPSSSRADAEAWRWNSRGSMRVDVIQVQNTVEEFFMDNVTPGNIFGMYSSALYVLRKLHGDKVCVRAFASHEVLRDKRVALAYEALSSLDIPIDMSVGLVEGSAGMRDWQ